ncbi:hypothetical protein SLEP1_g53062 [Rubroshorea leprosula]|uniref:Uncharacterized protein n=1 Tax=Rubroshorea leprosula TaxID=152421 RepID=A0AAV5MA11_9ROSI|nr:hypothetical protein SLEP1_g53062 [Rubroshorea leprosula]
MYSVSLLLDEMLYSWRGFSSVLQFALILLMLVVYILPMGCLIGHQVVCVVKEEAGKCCMYMFSEEEKGIFSEELEKFGKAIKELLVTLDEDLGFEMLQTGGLEGVTAMNSSGSQNLEMIQTGGLEGVSAMYSIMETPFERAEELKRKREEELDEARQGKRPATAYATPSRPPIGGFMAEARQNYGQSVAALATQGSLFSTNEGTQIQLREAAHGKEASTSSMAPPQVELRMFTGDELGLGSKTEVSVCDLVEVINQIIDYGFKFQLKDYEAFCEGPGIADMFKDSRDKEEQEFMEELKKLEEVLMSNARGTRFSHSPVNTFSFIGPRYLGSREVALKALKKLTSPNERGSAGRRVRKASALALLMMGYCEGELQSSTTWTTPLTAGAMNSTATEVSSLVLHDPSVSRAEPHHDPLGMQGGTVAAGSSGDPTTQSSPHNEKV